jgi:phosphoadenosine phosphosulfate reductase
MKTIHNNIADLNKKYGSLNTEEVLVSVGQEFGEKAAFSSSMGAEDQVLLDMIARTGKQIKIFTLDTGRLFPETYELIEKCRKNYSMEIEVYFPHFESVEKMIKSKGINLFYASVENRKQCCHIRKTEPLKRALSGMDAWITGIRNDQTLTRFNTKLVEWDEPNNLIKINPLLKWTEKMVWEYIHQNNVPYNELHDKGFPSIGCQPCTRAVNAGDDPRSGRWWWEDQGQKECGLHVKE